MKHGYHRHIILLPREPVVVGGGGKVCECVCMSVQAGGRKGAVHAYVWRWEGVCICVGGGDVWRWERCKGRGGVFMYVWRREGGACEEEGRWRM